MKRNEKGQFIKGQNIVNLKGKIFGQLKVIEMIPKTTRKTYWLCQCSCGNQKEIRSDSLLSGKTISCGCHRKQQALINLKPNKTHDLSNTRLYKEWQGMKKRCLNKKDKRFSSYGGRGISICKQWLEFENFCEWAMNNGYQENLSIDRINNNGNYEPNNCKWSTNKEQCNNRRTNILICYKGKTKTLMQWCEELNLNYKRVHNRYRRGIPLDDVFYNGDLRHANTEVN